MSDLLLHKSSTNLMLRRSMEVRIAEGVLPWSDKPAGYANRSKDPYPLSMMFFGTDQRQACLIDGSRSGAVNYTLSSSGRVDPASGSLSPLQECPGNVQILSLCEILSARHLVTMPEYVEGVRLLKDFYSRNLRLFYAGDKISVIFNRDDENRRELLPDVLGLGTSRCL
jgi:hypothetical protein